MPPHITTRDSIRMPVTRRPDVFSESQEPTSTLVLTSSHNRFIDIRILKVGEAIPPIARNAAIFPLSYLDWAFAGTCSSGIIRDVQDGTSVLKDTWTHWVDSRTTTPETVTDEGFMFPQSDGRMLEKGSMIDPRTGRLEQYEEMWRDVPILRLMDKKNPRLKCAVLTTESTRALTVGGKVERTRGMVMRIGQYCQGMLMVGEALAVERWEWTEQGGWQRSARMGDLFLPCGVAMDFDRLQLHGRVTYEDLVWHVVEKEEI